jgi:hypothetical protein
MSRRILLTGLGDIGEHWLHFIARIPGVGKIVACDLNPLRKEIVDVVVAGAMHQGYYPNIEFRKIDLFNVENTAELIKEVDPEAICNTACIQSWWEMFTLPRKMFIKLMPSVIGSWVPMHLCTSYSLMKAVKEAGYLGKIPVEITTLPDIVAPALANVGLDVTCGGGNAQLRLPRMKQIVSEEMNVPVSAVEIWQVGEHGGIGTPDDPAPWWIKIEVNGDDVTEELGGIDGMRKRLFRPYWDRESRVGPPPQQAVSAAFLSNFIDVLFDTKRFVGTVTGVKGLLGGYPVRLGRKVELALPREITLAEAQKINEEAARKVDAFEELKRDSTCVVTEAAHEIMKEVFEWDHREWGIEENEELAIDLSKRFKKLKTSLINLN